MSNNLSTDPKLESAAGESDTTINQASDESVLPVSTMATKKSQPDCPICLLCCEFPTILPCGHIFCFLCVKGVAFKNRRCAMCRREIPAEFLERPQLVNGTEDINAIKGTEDGYQWFYEGRNGWWQYDDRTTQDIEEAYKKNDKTCTILVAGYVYIVDLEALVQQRQNEPSRCRRVKRDLATMPKKGVAGLRIEDNIVRNDDSRANLQQTLSNRGAPGSAATDIDNLNNLSDGALHNTIDIVDATLDQHNRSRFTASNSYANNGETASNDMSPIRITGENRRESNNYVLSEPPTTSSLDRSLMTLDSSSSRNNIAVRSSSLASAEQILMQHFSDWNLHDSNADYPIPDIEDTTIDSTQPLNPTNM